METLRLTKDKYDRVLATSLIDGDTPIDIAGDEYYMVILIVDTKSNNAMERFQSVARRLSEKKVFTIAIFVTGRFDWTFDNALMFGISAWLTATTVNDAKDIANDIQMIIDNSAPIGLDLADIKTILYKNEGRSFYYGSGLCNIGNLKSALDMALRHAQESGMSIYECSKFLIAISTTSDLTKEQMFDLNGFINNLAEKHSGYFEIKWGLAHLTDTGGDTIKVTLIASH